MSWISKYKLYIIGAVVGAIAGYAYWHYIGCLSGTCAITSKPLNSTIYFGVMGALVAGMFKRKENQPIQKEETPNTN